MGIRFENTVTPSAEQWKAAIMGARNPMNSWDKSDSGYCFLTNLPGSMACHTCKENRNNCGKEKDFIIGPNDFDLMKRLCKAGRDHRKFMRMLPVMVTITAPLYWWKEFSTYKVGTVENSSSTMHKIADKEFTLEDFSCEHLIDEWIECNRISSNGLKEMTRPKDILEKTIFALNVVRDKYIEISDELKRLQKSYIIGALDTKEKSLKIRELQKKKKHYWWQMIQLLPSSYNQKRTVMMNYEVLANIYKSRKNHRLDEWSVEFIEFIKSLPYSELITYEDNKNVG